MERKQSNKLKRLRETAEEFWNLAETQWTAPAPRLERKQAQTLTASLANLLIRTDGDEDDDQDYFENYD